MTAFSRLKFSLVVEGPIVVSYPPNLISPTPRVGCTAVHSLARLSGLKNWFTVRPRTGCLG